MAFGTQLCFRELARVAVVGKKEAVTVFEPMTACEFQGRHTVLAAFSQALELFYQGKIPEALEAFSAIQAEDAPAAHYVAKCRELLENPPDMSSWEGVWVATSK